jgi:23S rRNA (uridine2552-2'-O)-methyltransferase
MNKNRTSKSWINKHISDPYVKRAKVDGHRSRAAYKLIEIDRKYTLLRKGMTLVDLGSAPGGWAQVAAKKITKTGNIIAVDLLQMNEIPNVNFIQGDFRENKVLKQLEKKLNNSLVDLVISDMAPNISGIKAVDQSGIIHLNELTLDFSKYWLKPNGNMLVKSFIGAEFDNYIKILNSMFKKVIKVKPDASRGRSSEIFVIGYEKKE